MSVVLVNDALPGAEYETSEQHARVLAQSGWYPKTVVAAPAAAGADTTEADPATRRARSKES